MNGAAGPGQSAAMNSGLRSAARAAIRRPMVRPPALASRAALLAAALAALVAGVLAGLARLGWDLPPADRLAMLHGPLMVSGFFGALIGLERAVAVGRPAAYLAPLAAGLA